MRPITRRCNHRHAERGMMTRARRRQTARRDSISHVLPVWKRARRALSLFLPLSSVLMMDSTEVFAASLSLDGVDDFVESSNTLNIATNEVTLEAWFFPTESTGAYQIVQLHTADSLQVSLSYANGRARFLIRGQGGGEHRLPMNQWTHIAGTVGSGFNMFINGASIAGSSGATQPMPISSKVRVSIDIVTEDQFFPGWIDEVRVWEDRRTDEEIATHWQHPFGRNRGGVAGLLRLRRRQWRCRQ